MINKQLRAIASNIQEDNVMLVSNNTSNSPTVLAHLPNASNSRSHNEILTMLSKENTNVSPSITARGHPISTSDTDKSKINRMLQDSCRNSRYCGESKPSSL